MNRPLFVFLGDILELLSSIGFFPFPYSLSLHSLYSSRSFALADITPRNSLTSTVGSDYEFSAAILVRTFSPSSPTYSPYQEHVETVRRTLPRIGLLQEIELHRLVLSSREGKILIEEGLTESLLRVSFILLINASLRSPPPRPLRDLENTLPVPPTLRSSIPVAQRSSRPGSRIPLRHLIPLLPHKMSG